MTIDNKLNWEEHINKLRAKAMKALNNIKVVVGKKWGGDRKTLKKLYKAICRLWLPNIQHSFCMKTKETGSKHRESKRIYTEVFRTSPVKFLHVEANDPPLELRRNELGLRFLYKLKSNSSYIETLNTLDNNKDQNYEE